MMQEKRLAGPEGRRDGREPCSGPARLILGDTVKAGALSYDRERDLPRLIRCDPNRDMEESAEAAEAIMARLRRALRAERNKARSGHWTYDLNRHIALRQAYVAETERLAHRARRSLDRNP